MTAARIGFALRLLLAGVFLFSALSKLPGVGLFEIAIVEQGLAATRAQAAHPARLLIAFELFLGLALLFPFYLKRAILPLAMATFVGFIALQGYQLTLGEQTQDCGCFGELLPMSSAESLIKNIILLGLSLWLYKITPEQKRRPRLLALLALGSLITVLVLAPVRQDYEANFAQYTQFEKAGRVDLTRGDKLVAVFNADCEHCQETAQTLDELAKKNAAIPKIYVLMFSEDESAVSAFSEKTHTNYPYHLITASEFFDLIGDSPPRVFWLQDGRIKARWDDQFAESILAAFDGQPTALTR